MCSTCEVETYASKKLLLLILDCLSDGNDFNEVAEWIDGYLIEKYDMKQSTYHNLIDEMNSLEDFISFKDIEKEPDFEALFKLFST